MSMSHSLDDHLFRLMVERVQDYAIFLLDTQGHVRSWNAGAARIKQYAASEIIGRHFSTFYSAEDKARSWPQEELRRALIEGRFEDNGWRMRKDGSRFWANVIITALRDDKGVLVGYSKITRDLTARKKEEEDLRESEERFRLLVDGVQDYAIYMLSPDGVVTSWNSGAHRIKGYAASEIIGRHFSRFYEQDAITAGKPWIELAIAREHGRAEDEGWRVRKDGTRFWARVVVTALHDSSGELRGFAKVTQDLTQRRHAESLEETSQKLNDFIAVLAHELRNPLAPIRNAVAILKDAPKDQVESVRQIVDRQSAQLARIVDDLLDIGRVTRGALTIQRAPLEVDQVVSRALEIAQPGINAAGHSVERKGLLGLRVAGDEVRLVQALSNVLNNAVRYTDHNGSISVSVAREGTPEAPMVAIHVKDNGHGIEPGLLGSIFGMFVQGRHSPGKTQTGLGVGLALARTIVELHHGTVEARSEGAGKGSEFILRLPILQTAEKPAGVAERRAPAPQAPAHPIPGQPRARKRVLIVDDNVDAAMLLAEMLKMQGHDVLAVNGGLEALSAVDAFRPEIILLDLGMPGMNGFEVARRLRERKRSPEPLIVAVTGWGKAEDLERTREAGFDLHLVKPVEEMQLSEVFEQMSPTRH